MTTDLSLIRILTVDDHPLLRKGIAALVNAETDMKLVAEASNGEEAIEKFRSHRPDVTLMDLQMPGLNGIEAIIRIQSEFPNARIIVLTTYTGDAQVVRALKAGARAYLLKRQVHRELLETIRAVHAGQRRIPSEMAAELVDHLPGVWQRVPLGEREGLQRLADAKHGAKWSLARTLLSLTVFYFCSTAWIWALDPGRRISQYSHTAWRVRDGAFAGAPSTITQTTDGYVWVGTLAGLVRFDGVRFVSFAPPAGQHLPNPAVISLLGATDGSLWIGTASGLAQWKNGELFTFPEITGRVNSIYEDRDGTIWIARSRTDAGGVCKVAASVATCYAPKDGVPPYAQVLIRDNLGFFLIGHPTGIVRWQPGSSTSYEVPGLKSKPGLAGISDLALAPDGSVWVGIFSPGHGLGLEQFVNRSWKTF